jgi:cysteine-S-conjugate beta-lyase
MNRTDRDHGARRLRLMPRLTPADPAFDNLDHRWLRSRRGAKWRVPARGVLPAWVADMDFPVAEPIRRRLAKMADFGEFGYPDWPDGVTPLRHLFAERMQRLYGWAPDPGHVREFTDIGQALQVALHLGSSPGDGVALHTPSFPPFRRSIEQTERLSVPIPMIDTPAGWRFDLERLEQDLAATPTRVLLLTNPHNPTGRVFSREDLLGLAEAAERHDLLVISDEVHSELVYEPHRHIPFASLGPEIEARTVTVTSATKGFNLAGIRCAVAHIGPPWLREILAGQPPLLYGNVSVFGVEATAAAWTECDDWLADIRRYLSGNRVLVADALGRRLPEVRFHLPEATYLYWLDCRSLRWGHDPARAFRSMGRVELSSGPAFNPGGDGFVRLNFATSRPLLGHLMDRIVRTGPRDVGRPGHREGVRSTRRATGQAGQNGRRAA